MGIKKSLKNTNHDNVIESYAVGPRRAWTNKRHIFIVGFVLLFVAILSLVLFNYYNNSRQGEDSYNIQRETQQKAEDAIAQEIEAKQKDATQGKPAASFSSEQLEEYYTNGLFSYINNNDNKGLIDYYINIVAPSKVTISRLDVKESVARALVGSGHNAELKALYLLIISQYKSISAKTQQDTAKNTINKIVQEYEMKAKSL